MALPGFAFLACLCNQALNLVREPLTILYQAGNYALFQQCRWRGGRQAQNGYVVSCVDLGGRRIIKKKKKQFKIVCHMKRRKFATIFRGNGCQRSKMRKPVQVNYVTKSHRQ